MVPLVQLFVQFSLYFAPVLLPNAKTQVSRYCGFGRVRESVCPFVPEVFCSLATMHCSPLVHDAPQGARASPRLGACVDMTSSIMSSRLMISDTTDTSQHKPAREPPALLCACITPGTTPGAPTRSSDLKQWSDLNPDRADPETAAWRKLESVATAA